MTGRPTKLTPAMHRKIVGKVKKGTTPSVAASVCGVHPSTYFAWMKRGRDGESPYVEFHDAIRAAEDAVQEEAENVFRKAFTGIKEKTIRRKLEKSEDTGRLVVVEEVRITVEKVYPQYALAWLQHRARDRWSPPKAKEQPDLPPDKITAGGDAPEYDDPWLETGDDP